jgi:UDP:flavonoid glycosyltransferase YjiC (YdhE family)
VLVGLAGQCGSLEVLVTSICIRSHFHPLVGPVRELVSRGHSVSLLLYGRCEAWVGPALGPAAANVSVTQSSIDLTHLSVDPHDEPNEALYEFGDRYEVVFPQMYQTASDLLAENEHKKYDVILCDVYSLGTMVVAEQQRIPLVVNMNLLPPINSPFYKYDSWALDDIRDSLQLIYGIRAVCKSGSDKVMALRRNLVLDGEYLSPFDYALGFAVANQGASPFVAAASDARYKKLGFSALPQTAVQDPELLKWIKKSEKPIVFVSLGGLTHIDYDEIASVMSAGSDFKYRFLYSLNMAEIKQFREKGVSVFTDDTVFISGDLPRPAILNLPQVHAFVSHCAALPVLESISAEKPLICRPGITDQFPISKLVASQGLGVTISTDLKLENLQAAISQIEARGVEFRANHKRVNAELRKGGGDREYVDFLEKSAANKITYKRFDGRIWPLSYALFYSKMPLVVAVGGGLSFVSINVILFTVFAKCSRRSEKQKAS